MKSLYIPYPVTVSLAWPDPTYPGGLATREYGPGAQLMGAQKFNDKHVLNIAQPLALFKSSSCIAPSLIFDACFKASSHSPEQSFEDYTMSSSSADQGANNASDREALMGAQHEEDFQLQCTGKH